MPDKTELADYSPEDKEAMERMLDEGGISVPEEKTVEETDFEQKRALILEILKLILGD